MTARPKCPDCGSSKVGTEANVGVAWSRGDWRVRDEPFVDPDASASCDCGWVGLAKNLWDDGAQP